mgnify:CR=1 FL=1|tara:strand:+ start:6590 stop:10066 length:3477 start_codon:yes stop_codon:yes gene_type:complete
MEGVVRRLAYWGFRPDGATGDEPQKVAGGYIMRGDVFDDAVVPERWSALNRAISAKGFEEVVEEAAYTWFNRMVAMQVLAKNDYEIAQLEFAKDDDTTPLMLQRARRGDMAFLEAEEQSRVAKLLATFTKDQEAFAQLLTGYCRSHRTLSRVFGKPDDYTELLLPDDMLQEGGFLHLLNTAEALTDEEFQKVELIGWLYQFYISEKKDEVFDSFGKGKKAEAKDIPAATQIFTPNWIVKYMVENTAGKVWLDKHPNSPLKGEMKYLVENESDGTREPIIKDVEELTLIDPACGSGHILVEGFDLLYKMHMERYYSPEDAVDSILKHNLFGLDIDDRAAQLATFAVLLKAAQCDRNVWSRDVLPNVHSMPEKRPFGLQEVKDFLGKDGVKHATELDLCLMSMQDAKNRGSVMKLKLSSEAHDFVSQRFNELKEASYRDFNEEAVLKDIAPFIPVLLALTRKYTSVVANPPYMGQKNMNADLKNYVNKHYPISKSDLFAVFMESSLAQASKPGYVGMINQHSWMFLSSYEKLRVHLLENHSIVNMLHLGPRAFEELSGEVVQSTAFVLANGGGQESGAYHRLVDERNIHEKEAAFLAQRSCFLSIPQTNFSKIPGSPIAYWVSEAVVRLFSKEQLSDLAVPRRAIQIGDTQRFRRNWPEVSIKSMEIAPATARGAGGPEKWYLAANGGTSRKWYGNLDYVILWGNHGEIVKSTGKSIVPNEDLYFDECVVWNRIASNDLSFRHHDAGMICGDASPFLHSRDLKTLKKLLALMNGVVGEFKMKILNPTLAVQTGSVAKIPVSPLVEYGGDLIEQSVNFCVSISRRDYNQREYSMQFSYSPLIQASQNLETAFYNWLHKASDDFFQLHKNEEELNRIFIDIYGLQDELTPEVALKDITILQEELDKKDLEALESTFRDHGGQPVELPIDRDEVMRQFVSYCVGLMMGRYRLDKPGLNIAHPNPSAEELSSYEHNGHRIEIDDDAILPLMGSDCQFPDDVLHRMQGLLDAIWGGETRTANLNFMQACLGKDLEKYLVKDFFKDHCKRYKKKPIYWLFSSPKGAFQVLAYMHRMNAFTVEKIRSNYLLDHLRHLRQEEQLLAGNEAGLSSQDGKRLDRLRKDIAECEVYDLELKDVADAQIAFDLDAGVTENHKLFGKVVAKIK